MFGLLDQRQNGKRYFRGMILRNARCIFPDGIHDGLELLVYGGKIVEECEAKQLSAAKHPYTRALLQAVPALDRPKPELAVMTRDPDWIK